MTNIDNIEYNEQEEEEKECDCCRYSPVETKLYEGSKNDDKKGIPQRLCNVCASTMVGKWNRYWRQHDNGAELETMKMIAWGINYLKDSLDSLKGSQERT